MNFKKVLKKSDNKRPDDPQGHQEYSQHLSNIKGLLHCANQKVDFWELTTARGIAGKMELILYTPGRHFFVLFLEKSDQTDA